MAKDREAMAEARRFSPITLQETRSLASRPFTLEIKVERLRPSKMPAWQHFFDTGNGNQTMVERQSIFLIKKSQNLHFITYFQPIPSDSQQSLATHSHILLTAIV